ncbi:MAG TPA: IPT/TIG domain-containing protein [Thermoanaerobaculia bacterium]|nr:IPT/TIG domain-containing protein [Thermoanaerobaculia bacterium]
MKRIITAVVLSLLMIVAGSAAAAPKTLPPQARALTRFDPINVRQAAERERANPSATHRDEIEEIEEPQPPPPAGRNGVPIGKKSMVGIASTPSFNTGTSPGPLKTFRAEFLSSTSIPPDTMGAVGTTHVVTVTNDRMTIATRDGVELARLTFSAFWAGVTLKSTAISAFDPKVYFDRFNNRFILVGSGNGQSNTSGAMFAVSATADPTGTWYRWSAVADPTSTGAPGGSGRWIDYPSVGFNKNWIVVSENTFNYSCGATPATCANTGFWGTQIFVLDKQAAYSNTLSTISLFEAGFTATCGGATPETELGCGFTMAPAITEDNTTDTEYLVEDWDSQFGQLRVSKITGTPSAPVIASGTQFPQSANSWRFNASRISNANTIAPGGTVTSSGGYIPQRQQSAHLVSGTRIAGNDSRIQNAVLRNGKLWAAHTVMLSATAQAAGTAIGSAAIPDTHSGIQWWQIDPSIEDSVNSTAPLQRGRIEDPAADNCHNGTTGLNTAAGRCNSTLTQTGEFYAFPNISVNANEDVFIGFTRFSALTYPNSGYAIRKAGDPVNTVRDTAIFRPGQSNYNIGSGNSTCAPAPCTPSRNNRWGDYSAAQTDPVNDIDFWTVQEYSGTYRNDFLAPSYAAPWETWWAMVRPTATAPTAGSLIISEFRLRGPQGVRDEFVELYNPSATPVIVASTDGTDGWGLGYSTNGTAIAGVAVVPNGTVIAPHGHFLIANNPDATGAGGLSTAVYSLNTASCIEVRGATSDTSWAFDLADNGGLALFSTSATANFTAGTRIDSAGFASIAAGLFKEGAGIPAITGAATGQLTFYRDLATGTPKDTGANESDFIFANTVVGENLGSTTRLGAAGPENLSSPGSLTGSTTLPAVLVDAGKGLGDAPNRFRDITVVANGANGTLTFRRKFTNNTGGDVTRMRFRIVDMTTNPPAATKADLRALTSTSTSVSLSGGGTANIDGTTLETPPTQGAGGGFNSTIIDSSVTLATPFLAGSNRNVQFRLGVQTGGIYNFCIEAEGSPAITTPAPLCFAGTTDNLNPQITPAAVSRTAGAGSSNSAIGTVTDDTNAPGSFTVTASNVPAGITVTNIVNVSGNLTADISVGCPVTTGAYNVTLTTSPDSDGATATALLTINVTGTPAPTTPTLTADTNGTGTQNQACPAQPLTLHAASTGAVSYQWYKDGNLLGGETASSYVATSAGTYTATATNLCGTSSQSTGYIVQNPTPQKANLSTGTPTTFCQGGSVTINSDVASGNYQWFKDNVAIAVNGTSQSYVASASGSYTLQVTSLGCANVISDAVVVTVNPLPATPTITPSGPTTFCANGSVTLTSSSATGNQWSLDGNPINLATGQQYVATLAGNYTVVVTDGNSCSSASSAATAVTVNPLPATPTITPGGPTTFCQGGSVTLTSSSATGNQWYLDGNPLGGETGQNYVATASGSYTVVVTDGNSCSSAPSAGTTVTVNPIPPQPTIGTSGPTTFCQGGSVTLTSSSATGNQWSLNGNPINLATSQQYVASVGGNYTVIVTTSGCSSPASAATNVIVNPTPNTPTINASGPTTFCQGGSVTLTSSSATGNQWYLNGNPIGGQTAQQYVASASGNYTVVVTASSCPSAPSAATNVIVNPTPNTPTINASGPTTFCQGGSVTLTSSSATGNQWYLNGNPIGGQTAQQYVANANGNYTVVVTASSCPSAPSAATNVIVNPTPATPTIAAGGPTAFCTGGSVTLTSSSSTGNQWLLNGNPIGGQTAQQYVATAAGDYSVFVTTSGCASAPSAVTTVTVNPTPNANITAAGSVVSGSTGNAASVASAGAGATYNWSITNGTITSGQGTNAIAYTAGAAGSLTLQVTVTAAGCPDTKSANVNVTAAPPAVTITSVTPNAVSYLGGRQIVIAGTGFLAGATVTIGGNAATNVTVNSATQITARTPAHAPGPVNVTVTNTNATSATLTNGLTYLPQQFDANGDGIVDPSDIFYLVNYLFLGGPAPRGAAGLLSGDANGDGIVDPADIFYVVNYLYLGGPTPAAQAPRVATNAISAPFAGSMSLGSPVRRDGRVFVPVIVDTVAGSEAPQALSLKVRGEALGIERTVALQPAFEISRAGNGQLSYLVVFDPRNGALSVNGATVIAQIEVSSLDAASRLAFDPSVTMFTNAGATRTATVANGALRLGTKREVGPRGGASRGGVE